MQIIHYPHPTLRHKSKPVRRVDSELKRIIAEMFQLMYAARGVGLAANQVNLPLRLFVMNLQANPQEGEELVMINPLISRPKGLEEQEEGCLSLPGLYGSVVRPKRVRITAYNLQGEVIDQDVEGLFARVVQHETDHLDGILFPDRMTEAGQQEVGEALERFTATFEERRGLGEIESDEAIRAGLAEWEARYT